MLGLSHLTAFLIAATVLVLTPGPNTLLILSQSLSGGRAVGIASAFGVETGTLMHTGLAAFGVSALLYGHPAFIHLLKYVGGGYLILLGVGFLRSEPRRLPQDARGPLLPLRAFRLALLTNVTNPKTGLFFFAFLPQFIRPGSTALLFQIMELGTVVAGLGLSWGVALALLAASIRGVIEGNTQFEKWRLLVSGATLLVLGVWIVFTH